MKPAIVLMLCILLCGCGGLDQINRRNRAVLEPLGDQRFRYTVFDSTAHLIRGEATYERWLSEAVAENGLCTGGYDISERGQILLGDNALDRTERRYFIFKCQ